MMLTAVKAEERVYPLGCYEVKEDVLYDMVEIAESFEDVEESNYHHKKLCNFVRGKLGISNIISFAQGRNKKDNSKIVLVIEYPIVATEENFYKQLYDESINSPYILL